MVSKYSKERIPWNSVSLTGDMLMALLAAGSLCLGMINPAFFAVGAVLQAFQKEEYKKKKKDFQKSFRYLQQRDFLHVESRRGKVFLSLTAKGKQRAELYAMAKRLRDLKLSAATGKNRYLVLFDVKSEDRLKRDAFRAFLKRFGCMQLQKSVWLSLYDCREEVRFLKEFFDMTTAECRVVVVSDLGGPVS